jgi:hypothetical protein
MSLLPDTDRILLGPGPSLTAPRVMRAMASPTLSHLDPLMLALLDDVRARLGRIVRAPEGSLALAISGTGTSGMEAAVANLVKQDTRVLVVVTGYFGDRLAQICQRYGATVTRLDVEWGRACDPDKLRRALSESPADIVAVVHADTSRARCTRPGGRGYLAWRASARRCGVGSRCVLQLHAEMSRCAVRIGADCLHAARAGTSSAVPEFLSRPVVARGFLDPA